MDRLRVVAAKRCPFAREGVFPRRDASNADSETFVYSPSINNHSAIGN
jgi:hypothetical protein